MRIGLKRRFSAWLLLAVFLPMLVLSALHVHAAAETAADMCTECVNHSGHHGHLTQTAASVSDCVLCQFLSLSYLETAPLTLTACACLSVLLLAVSVTPCVTRPGNTHAPRAPPYCMA
ncbi:MAG: hypothetical protein IJ527_05310 [Prevotella sp.]|nr:hypothetical protein [Prevotella sp.]